MRDIFEVIGEKESEIKRINGELDALRFAVRLLEEDEADVKKKSPASARESLPPMGTGTQFP